jgi:hypothetical protein
MSCLLWRLEEEEREEAVALPASVKRLTKTDVLKISASVNGLKKQKKPRARQRARF